MTDFNLLRLHHWRTNSLLYYILFSKLMYYCSQIKPVRDSMNEALQSWKKIAGKGDGSPDDSKPSSGRMFDLSVIICFLS